MFDDSSILVAQILHFRTFDSYFVKIDNHFIVAIIICLYFCWGFVNQFFKSIDDIDSQTIDLASILFLGMMMKKMMKINIKIVKKNKIKDYLNFLLGFNVKLCFSMDLIFVMHTQCCKFEYFIIMQYLLVITLLTSTFVRTIF